MATLTDWGSWRRTHPETLALDADGGPTAFDIDRMLIAVELVDESLAVPVDALRAQGVVNAEVGGVPLAFVADAAPGGWWGVYSRRLDDRVIVLARVDGELIERHGTGRWDPVRGLPLAGEQRLDALGALTISPRDFPVHFPGGRVWSPTQQSTGPPPSTTRTMHDPPPAQNRLRDGGRRRRHPGDGPRLVPPLPRGRRR